MTTAILFALLTTSPTVGARLPASKQTWQVKWWVWLPDKWRRVARCETHLDFRFHNRDYVSAFGISRRAYDEDARVMGAPRWDDEHIPTPWHQFRAALGHYRLHSGFSGWGCRGA